MTYVIECCGALIGPFESEQDAADYAIAHSMGDWRVRAVVNKEVNR